jgi:hypothetical protein
MKHTKHITILICILISACNPAVTPVIQSWKRPASNVSTQPTEMTSQPVAATVASGRPFSTKTPQKHKGEKPPTPGSEDTTPKVQNDTPTSNNEVMPAITEFVAPEILGRPTDSSVTVNIVPSVTMQVYYEYGTTPGVYSGQTIMQEALADTPLETLIGELQPDTRYYYRIHYNDQVGQEHTFVTQRAPGSIFTFDLQGDSHPERIGKEFNADLYTHTLQSVATDQPDFYLTIGDDFSVDQLKTVNAEMVRQLYINQRQWLGLVGAPVFLVNGNHEQASLANLNGTSDNVAVWAQTARDAYFPQPAPDTFYTGDAQPVQFIGPLRDYYAFPWGDALFIVIDFYWHSPEIVDNAFGAGHAQKPDRDPWNATLGDAQYQWLKTTLQKSSAKYKFVFTHHVLGTGRGGVELAGLGEWGDSNGLAVHRPGWEKTIQQLMAENHVTIFFQGHDHIFACQELDGVVYQTLPEPADPNYSLFNAEAYQSGDILSNSGHVRVTVSPTEVKVDYIRSYLDRPDELAYSYSLR